ncbi:RnfH family protein [Lysobacter sp. N42]|uniref:RnfH family protein n=1 Tax=Gammaproteobacteria TaxID=1236 RepID=UPI001A9D3000|nr:MULTISPECIES: RnfH family protein [Gammaproteobacteria]
MAELVNVEVVYGTPEKQKIVSTQVPEGTTVEKTIELSQIDKFFPEFEVSADRVGIWNRTCKLTDTVKNGDRVEIYRPLIADPKEIRRRRAERAKEEGRADKVTGGRPDKQRSESKSSSTS